jgi:hypothetical protein
MAWGKLVGDICISDAVCFWIEDRPADDEACDQVGVVAGSVFVDLGRSPAETIEGSQRCGPLVTPGGGSDEPESLLGRQVQGISGVQVPARVLDPAVFEQVIDDCRGEISAETLGQAADERSGSFGHGFQRVA